MPPKGQFRTREADMVDGQKARFDLLRQRRRCFCRARKRIRGKAIRQTVGFRDRFLDVMETIDERDRPERFLIHRAGCRRHIGENGRFEEIAFVADPLAARLQRRALCERIRDQLFSAATRRGLASGPMRTPSSKPLPILIACAKAISRSRKSSKTFSCTRKRVGEMQVCPALRYWHCRAGSRRHRDRHRRR